MSKMELILVEVKEGKKFIREIYVNEFYEITKRTSIQTGLASLDVDRKSYEEYLEYLPSIFVRQNFDDSRIEGFEILTTSYGSKDIHDIEKIIEGYHMAIDTVKELEKKFVMEDR